MPSGIHGRRLCRRLADPLPGARHLALPLPKVIAATGACCGAAGEAALAPTTTRRLTERELTVFTLIAAGRSNREIAAQLHLSEGTVKVHVGRILAKLDLRDRVQAVILAYETGLITPGS